MQTFVSIGSTHPNPNPLSHLPLPHPCARAAAERGHRGCPVAALHRRRPSLGRAAAPAADRGLGARRRCGWGTTAGVPATAIAMGRAETTGQNTTALTICPHPRLPPLLCSALLPGRMPRVPPATARRDTKHKPESVSARAITPWYWRASTAPAGHWTSSPEKKAIVPSSPEKKAPARKKKRPVQLSILVLSTFLASNFNILF